MRFSLLTIAFMVASFSPEPSFAAANDIHATSLTVTNIDGPVVPGRYIVKLKENANTANHLASMASTFLSKSNDTSSPVTHNYTDRCFNGYAGLFSRPALAAILASPDVELVQPDAIVSRFLHCSPPMGSSTMKSN